MGPTRFLGSALAGFALFVLPIQASATLYSLSATLLGANEVPGPGDPDGFGTATLTIDDSTTPFPSVTWSIVVGNIALPPTGAHIHQGAAGVSGPVRVDFSAQLTGGPLQDSDLTGVLANPAGWYVNVHNSAYPGGAIRGQLALVPEPGTLALVGLGAALLASRRRTAS